MTSPNFTVFALATCTSRRNQPTLVPMPTTPRESSIRSCDTAVPITGPSALRASGVPYRCSRSIAAGPRIAGRIGADRPPWVQMKARVGRGRRDSIRNPADGRAPDLLDDAAVLVAERRRLGDRLETAVWPQVGSTNAGCRQSDDRVSRSHDLRVRDFFEAHVMCAVQDSSAH